MPEFVREVGGHNPEGRLLVGKLYQTCHCQSWLLLALHVDRLRRGNGATVREHARLLDGPTREHRIAVTSTGGRLKHLLGCRAWLILVGHLTTAATPRGFSPAFLGHSNGQCRAKTHVLEVTYCGDLCDLVVAVNGAPVAAFPWLRIALNFL